MEGSNGPNGETLTHESKMPKRSLFAPVLTLANCDFSPNYDVKIITLLPPCRKNPIFRKLIFYDALVI